MNRTSDMGDMKVQAARIDEAVAVVREKLAISPRAGLILGTGLGEFARRIDNARTLGYREIPHFPHATVDVHAGRFVAGEIAGKPVVAMEGRIHVYEGYSAAEVAFPVRVIKALGAGSLVVTCSCGSLNPQHNKGDLLLIEDHINLMGTNPLIGRNDDRLGLRFPDMVEPYHREYIKLAESIALRNGIRAARGVYAAMTGPCLETRAEYRMLQRIGADAIGMSTVPEVIVAVHAGLKVLGVAVLTDVCLPDCLGPCDIAEIVAVAEAAGPKLERVLLDFLAEAPL